MSCARVREYASGATTWAKRSSPGDLAAWVGTAWGEDKNVCFVGSGADGAWSGFAVTGFGRKQSYNWGPDIDKMKEEDESSEDEKKQIDLTDSLRAVFMKRFLEDFTNKSGVKPMIPDPSSDMSNPVCQQQD